MILQDASSTTAQVPSKQRLLVRLFRPIGRVFAAHFVQDLPMVGLNQAFARFFWRKLPILPMIKGLARAEREETVFRSAGNRIAV